MIMIKYVKCETLQINLLKKPSWYIILTWVINLRVRLITEMDRNGPKWTEMDRNGPKWTEMEFKKPQRELNMDIGGFIWVI